MTHDPLCPNRKVMLDFPSEIECGSCTFIAKVRADQEASHDRCLCHQLDAIGRVGGQVNYISIEGITLEDRNEVLDEAVDAVMELPCTNVISLDDETWHEPALIERGKVIAAIDALRGES